MLSTSIPAWSSARTRAVARPGALSTAAPRRNPSALTDTRPPTRGAITSAASGLGQRHLDVRAAAASLQLAGRPVGDHLAVIDDHDAIRQGVRLVQVLGRWQARQRDAESHQVPDHLPDALPAHRVQARGRLIQEQHGRPRQQAGRQVRPGRRMPPEYPLTTRSAASASSKSSSSSAALARTCPVRIPLSSPTSMRFCLPVSNPSKVTSWAATPICLRTAAGWASAVDPGHPGLARVRQRQRGQDPHGCGLPGPVRPEQPQHASGGHGETDPGQRARLAVALEQAIGLDASCRPCHPPGSSRVL